MDVDVRVYAVFTESQPHWWPLLWPMNGLQHVESWVYGEQRLHGNVRCSWIYEY